MTATAITQVGALLADATRASLLEVLMDGRARTGGELARSVGVAPSTASEHLSRLLDARFVAVEAQGRHRYFRLAGSDVAELLEALGAREPAGDRVATGAPAELVHARSCYDHLAGRLAVRIHDRMVAAGYLGHAHDHPYLTDSGAELLAGLGVDLAAARDRRRPLVRDCLDWTERRHHLAGAAGAALFATLLERGWLARGSRPRSVRVTTAGQRGLADAFGV